ncbi:MAG: hypothetical protein PHE60_02275 [Sulfurospirillaceae bacterium]|nr:hypothetical protein [Sulfurospirillaceae bacterium]
MAISDTDINDIKNLDEVGLPALVYQIMYYEIAKLNLLNQGLDISLNTKTGDGGSDGEFNNFNKPIPVNHLFLPNSNVVFQFKATEIGDKPWFEHEILKSDKTDLKPKLKELIQSGYTYLLITNKTDLPAIKFEEKERVLKEVFKSKGYQNVSVKIFGLTKLTEWASSIPQIYLSRNLHTKYFELFDFYEREINQFSDDVKYINDKKRETSIAQIREEIDRTLTSQSSSFIRVEGFSGIGKTRFIYETLNDEKYKNFVLYVQSYNDSILSDLQVFCKKLPTNSQELVIFVIDECPYDSHVQIYRHLKTYPNLVVITIDQVLSTQDKIHCKDEKRIMLEGLEEAETVKLIQEVNHLLNDDLAKKIAYYTEGYPRLAYFMAESFDIEKGDTNNPDFKSWLLDNILSKITDKAEDIKILQAISIFKMFPNTDEFSQYKKIIFEHFKIDLVASTITIDHLVKKGIIRKAGRFLYISPRPISIHLFNQFIEINDYNFINELFQKLNNEGLMSGFFEKLRGVPFDTPQHKDLLFQILSKLTYEQISDGFGSKILYTLCLKDEKYSIGILKKLLKDKTKEDFLKLTDGRRYLVHTLEILIASKDTFLDSVRILFQLARAENESWGNNSKGVFNDTFQLILGGTEVNIVNRLELLKNLYKEYSENEDRLILLEALSRSYPQLNYMATHKNHATFPEFIPEHYHPETQAEIDAYFEKLKELITFVYENSSINLQSKILNDLLHSSRMMMQYNQINIWLLEFIEKLLSAHPYLKSLLFEEISMILKYDKDEKLSKAIIKRLKSLYNKFTDTTDIKEAKELFFQTERYRYNSEEAFEKHCKVIAQDIWIHRDYTGLLEKSTSNVFDLGKELAKMDIEGNLYEDILNLIPTLTKNSNNRFILAYLFNSPIDITENYNALFHEIYTKLNDKSLMLDFIHYSKPTEVSIKYLYMLLEKKEIESHLLENLTFGFWLRDLAKQEFVNFIDRLNSYIDNKCDSFILCMQYVNHQKDKELIEKYTKYYLEHKIFNCISLHKLHHDIDEMIDSYFINELELDDGLLSHIWEAILSEFDNEGKFEDRGFHSIYKIIQKYPEFFWEKIKNRLDELKPTSYPLYSRFIDFMQGGYLSHWFNHSIFSYINADDVISWLKTTNYKKAKYIVADSLNIDFKSDTLPDIVIKLLTEFPTDKDLYSSIQTRHESWSGSYVPVANEKISNTTSMLKLYENNESVVEFLKWAKEGFEYTRNREQIRDEEERLLY